MLVHSLLKKKGKQRTIEISKFHNREKMWKIIITFQGVKTSRIVALCNKKEWEKLLEKTIVRKQCQDFFSSTHFSLYDIMCFDVSFDVSSETKNIINKIVYIDVEKF